MLGHHGSAIGAASKFEVASAAQSGVRSARRRADPDALLAIEQPFADAVFVPSVSTGTLPSSAATAN
jgi:hypothetical protein